MYGADARGQELPPVKFSGHKRTGGALVPLIQGLRAEVVMLPATQDILGDGVEIVTAKLVTIIVVIIDGETISRVFARVAVATVEVVIHNAALNTSENKNLIFSYRCQYILRTLCLPPF